MTLLLLSSFNISATNNVETPKQQPHQPSIYGIFNIDDRTITNKQ